MPDVTAPTGRVALVTGAGRRLGAAMALALAEDRFDVFVHYGRSTAEAEAVAQQIRALGRRAVTAGADVRDDHAVHRLFAKLRTEFGRLDVLVNSASCFERLDLDVALPPETALTDWQRSLDVNLTGPFRFTLHARELLADDDGGLVVNLVDASGVRPWKGYLAHSVSKAGLVALTQGLARDLAPDIRVNAILPGPVLWPESYDARHRAAILKKVPLAREGSPADVVRALRYLVDADFVTGDVMAVEGGRLLT